MKTLTVITTTYNRAYCLHQVYDSLVKQACKDFIWLVIDDGSTDGTDQLIRGYQQQDLIEIEYYYKQNGGMHTARNAAYEKVHTEINMIIDSDDWVADGAVGEIVEFWKNNKRTDIAGIISLNADTNGKIVGTKPPDELKICHYVEYWRKYRVTGDKKLIYRSDLTRLYPYPEFPGEKFYPASYKFVLLDQDYKMLVLNQVTCIVDYNEDSMTYQKYAQYKACCRGFSHYCNAMIRVSKDPVEIIKETIHYIAESKFAADRHYIRNSAKPVYTLLCLPMGLAYHSYLCKTKRKY